MRRITWILLTTIIHCHHGCVFTYTLLPRRMDSNKTHAHLICTRKLSVEQAKGQRKSKLAKSVIS